jgi:ubiquitin carboxyl-terminal hydrolase 7
VQEIPREELEADDLDKVINVFHFSKELSRTHGIPFKFVVKRVRFPQSVCVFLGFDEIYSQGEKFSETKKRLQARIGASDKELSKYRFALIQVSTFKQPSYIEDGMSP